MTKDEVLHRLKTDPVYFIERFFWIIDKNRSKVPFLLNQPQRRYYENHSQSDLILKSRKEGFSSLIEAIWLHACMFNQNENAVTMAHTWEDTSIHLDRVRFFIENMGLKDIPMEVALDKDNQRELYFPNTNSRYWIGTAGAKAFGRGRDITRLHLSEIAHYPHQDVVTGVMEACVPNAWMAFETTANGVGELFHRMWKEANDPEAKSPWKPHFFAWYEDPTNTLDLPTEINFRPSERERRMKERLKLSDRQIYWYRQKESKMSDRTKMPQEYPSTPHEAFISSGNPAFNLERLAIMKERIRNEKPMHISELHNDERKFDLEDRSDGRLRIWKMPRKGRSYLICADPCEGVPGGDFAVAHILDRSSWEQVAIWRGRIDPAEFGRLLVNLGTFYNFAILDPELNNHGWATMEAIKAEEYMHVIKTSDLWGDTETVKEGFPMTEKTRALVISALRNCIDDGTSFIHDMTTLDECETFVRNDAGKFEAQSGCHDDCVISLAIGIYSLKFLTVDETYAHSSTNKRTTPLYWDRPVEQTRRRSATGYR